MHLSTMCHLFEESAKADIFVYWSARKTQTRKKMLRSCFLSTFAKFRSEVLEEKSKMSQPIRGQGGHLVFPIGPKNKNLVEDVEILLPVKFRWIPFSGFRGEVENVSANQRPGRPSFFTIGPKNTNLVEDVEILLPMKFCWIPFSGFRGEVENVSANQRPRRPSCFSDRSKKHKLGRGRWDHASCQVSLNSVQRFQRRSRKCHSQSEARAAILFFRSTRKTQTWKRTLRSCFLSSFVEFHSAVSEGKSKMSQRIRGQGGHLVFPIGPKNTKLGRGRWDLASCQVSLNSVQRFQRRSRKCLSQSEARAAILFFRSARKTQTW